MIPAALIALLAIVRLGAIHAVVFGGDRAPLTSDDPPYFMLGVGRTRPVIRRGCALTARPASRMKSEVPYWNWSPWVGYNRLVELHVHTK